MARAFGGNRASVQFNDVSRDRQAQPQTGMLSRAGRISLTKSIENKWQKLLGYTYAGITHGHFEVRIDARYLHRHESLAWRKLNGI